MHSSRARKSRKPSAACPLATDAETARGTGGDPRVESASRLIEQRIRELDGWLDALIVRSVPESRRTMKWNSSRYGVKGRGWFLGFHSFTRFATVAFFRGASLRPLPPGASKDEDARYLDIDEGELPDEAQAADCVRQAAALPGLLAPRS